MTNENSVQVFEAHHVEAFQKLSEITKTKKNLENQEKQLKENLEKAMDEHGIKSIDNQFLKITRVGESKSKSIDLKALENEEPKLYGELMQDYPKETVRKAHVKFTVK